MKEEMNIRKSREETAEYWDTHELNEIEGEEVDVEVRKPLSATLSMRLDQEHLSQLKLLAHAQDTGVTTMARRLLYQCLDNPGNQLWLLAMNEESVQEAAHRVIEESAIPPLPGAPSHFMISTERLEQIVVMIQEQSTRLLLKALPQRSVPVPEDKAKELEAANT